MVGEDPDSPLERARSAQKLPLVPAVISEGMRLHMKIQTHSPTSLPVLSTPPIDYYDGGTVRLNTEFYSWDTSFGLVNPRLRYSCVQVVFCVILGTFFKYFLQLGWRPTGVRLTLPECSLNVH